MRKLSQIPSFLFFFPSKPWWHPFLKQAWGMISTAFNCSGHKALVHTPQGEGMGRAKVEGNAGLKSMGKRKEISHSENQKWGKRVMCLWLSPLVEVGVMGASTLHRSQGHEVPRLQCPELLLVETACN